MIACCERGERKGPKSLEPQDRFIRSRIDGRLVQLRLAWMDQDLVDTTLSHHVTARKSRLTRVGRNASFCNSAGLRGPADPADPPPAWTLRRGPDSEELLKPSKVKLRRSLDVLPRSDHKVTQVVDGDLPVRRRFESPLLYHLEAAFVHADGIAVDDTQRISLIDRH